MTKPKCYKQLQLIIKKQIRHKNPLTILIIHCTLKKIRDEYGKCKEWKTIELLQLKQFGFNYKFN